MSFPPVLQRAVLRAILEGKLGNDPSAFPPELFSPDRQDVIREACRHAREYRAWPTLNLLEQRLISSGKSGEEVQQLRMLPPDEVGYAADQARKVLSKRAFEKLALKIADLVEEPSPDFTLSRKWIQEALRVGSPGALDFPFEEAPLSRHIASQTASRGYPTGLPELEAVKPGGLWQGEVGAILAGTNQGKSHMLVWLAQSALTAGHPVLFFSLEMSSMMVARRLDRCITGMTTEEIQAQPKVFEDAWHSRVAAPESLRIVHYPRRSVGVLKVREEIERSLETPQDRKLLVCVDYAQLLKGDRDDRHREVGEIYAELSALAQEFSVGIWTPHQLNRGGFAGADTGIHNAGESFEAMQHLDLVLGLSQDDVEKAVGEASLRVEKARESERVDFKVKVDWSRSRITPA